MGHAAEQTGPVVADLTVELRAWPQQTWTAVGISPEAALLAVVDRWRAGHVKGVADHSPRMRPVPRGW